MSEIERRKEIDNGLDEADGFVGRVGSVWVGRRREVTVHGNGLGRRRKGWEFREGGLGGNGTGEREDMGEGGRRGALKKEWAQKEGSERIRQRVGQGVKPLAGCI
jgi:hypothetical protein